MYQGRILDLVKLCELRNYDVKGQLEEKIQVLESKIEAIENRLNNKYSVVTIKKFEGKTVSRCYRLYEEVQKDFNKFCKENSNTNCTNYK